MSIDSLLKDKDFFIAIMIIQSEDKVSCGGLCFFV